MADIVTDAADTTPLLTTQGVTHRLSVSERTVHRLAASGRLERVRFGHRSVRYTARSVEALLALDSDEAPAGTDAPSKRELSAPHGEE